MLSPTKCLLAALLLFAAHTSFAQVSNDECSGAVQLDVSANADCGALVSGTTVGSTPSGIGLCELQLYDVWYSFTATATAHTLALSDIRMAPYGFGTNVYLEFFSGDCDNPKHLFCFGTLYYDDEIKFGDLVPGETYFIRIGSPYPSVSFDMCLRTPSSPPANDACTGAVALNLNSSPTCNASVAGSTQNATISAVPVCNDCFQTRYDVWYSYTATEVVEVISLTDINLSNNPGSQYQVWVSVFSGDCNNLSALSLNSDMYGQDSLVVKNSIPGQTYLISVGSNTGNADIGIGVDFNICVSAIPPPANDECSGAITIIPNPKTDCTIPFSGSLLAATPSIANYAGAFANDVWYQFTATSTAQRIVLNEGVNNEFEYEVYSGDCDNLVSLAFIWGDDQNKVVSGLTPGATYYLRILSQGDLYHNFSGCITTLPPPPANEICAQAETLVPALTTECSTPTPGSTSGVLSYAAFNCYNGYGMSVWYTFTATSTIHTLHINDVKHLYGPASFKLEWYEGTDCDNLNYRQCFDAPGDYYLEQLTPGQSYYFRCISTAFGADSFNICLGSIFPPPNDECANAKPLIPVPGLDCTQPNHDVFYGVTSSGTDCVGEAVQDVWYTFTATSPSHEIYVQPVYHTSYDRYGFELYEGDCNALVSRACNGPNEPYMIASGLTIGATYYLRVFSNYNLYFDTKICILTLPVPPVNDECSGAIPVIPVFDADCQAPLLQGSTLGATDSGAPCAGTPGRDVWYSFTAGTVSCRLLLNVTKYYLTGYYDPAQIQLYTGDCNNLLCPASQYNLTPGQTYFVRVSSGINAAHDFTLCVVDLPAPANDLCEQATTVIPNTAMNCDQVYPGTTKGASFFANAYSPDVWYTFTATSNSHIITFENIQYLFGNPQGLQFDLYRGADCTALSTFSHYTAQYPALIDTFLPGETYYLRVFTNNADGAYNFDLCIKTLPPSPPNEDCAGALELTPNTGMDCDIVTAGSTLGIIHPTIPGFCAGGNDVWYKFTATANSHEIQGLNVVQIFDPYYPANMAVLQGTCGNFTQLGCAYIHQSISLYKLTPGETYYIEVVSPFHWAANYDLCIKTIPPPPNDLCANAQALDVSTDEHCQNGVSGTTRASGRSGLTDCGTDDNDVWYSFVATQSAHIVSIHNVVFAQTSDAYVCGASLLGGDCGALETLACWSVNSGGEFTAGDLVVGNTYYIRVSGIETGVDFNICVGTPPPPPVNDICLAATELPVSPGETCTTPISGTLENANPTPALPNDPFASSQNDVWFTFTATQANHILHYTNQNYNGYNELELYSGTCDAFTKINQYLVYGDNHIILTNLTPGTVFYIRVSNYDNVPYTFDLCVTSPQAPPNDECDGATPLQVSTDLICQNQTSSTTYGATPSMPGCNGGMGNDIWFQFTATGSACRLNLYDISSFGIEILEGSCGALTSVLPCTFNNYVPLHLQNLVAGNLYYIRLVGLSNTFQDVSICLSYLPEPPVNDDCAQATVIQANTGLDCDHVYTGSTLGATQSALSCYDQPTHDVWYQFTATSETQSIDLHATGYPFGNNFGSLGFQIYGGSDCSNLNPVQCFENATDNPAVVSGLTIGEIYFLRIFTYHGDAQDFALCIRALPPPPPNIDCAGALDITPSPNLQCDNPVAGTTANLSANDYYGCNSGTSLWYKFTASSDAYLIKLQDTVHHYGSGFIRLELYYGNCDNGYYHVACPEGLDLYYLFAAPGLDYYIRVVGMPNSAIDFNLCVLTIVPPLNDVCAQATMAIPNAGPDCDNVYPGTNLGATSDQNSTADVWFTFTATSTTHAFELLNIDAVYGDPGEIYFDLYEGPDCDNLTLVTNFSTLNPALSHALTPGKTYFIRVRPDYNGSVFNFDLCIKTLPTSPPNEECSGAYELTVNAGPDCDIVTSGSTEGSIGVSPQCVVYGSDVWYKFTATASDHQIWLSNVTATQFGYLSAELLQSTDCVNFTSLGCLSDFNSPLAGSGLTPGETYYVRMGNLLGTAYFYDICVTTTPPPPNDLCANAIPLDLSTGQDCQTPIGGTTYGSGPSAGLSPCTVNGNDVWYTFTATEIVHSFSINTNGSFSAELYSGTCDNLEHLGCRNYLYDNSQITFGELNIGTLYYLRIQTAGHSINFEICGTTPPLPPANDACINAALLPVSPDENCVTAVSGSTEFATPSFPLPENGSGTTPNDVWYKFTATGINQLITVDNISNPYSFLQLDLYSGDCATFTLVGQQFLYNSNQMLLTALTPGALYYIRIYSYYASTSPATFDICVTSLTPPPNDECAGATPLPLNTDLNCQEILQGLSKGATPSLPGCNGQQVNDVWFQFTATSSSHRLSVTTSYFGMEVLEGSCGAFTPILPCAEYINPVSKTLQHLVVGKTYYIRLYPINNYFGYQLCLLQLPEPPANDECTQAIDIQTNTGINCDFIYAGSTLGATQSDISCSGNATHDVWYQFEATSTAHVIDLEISGYPLGNSGQLTGFQVYKGTDCTALSSVMCTEFSGASLLTLSDLQIGDRYFIRVFSNLDDAHDFTLCIRTPPPAPANTSCANAQVVLQSPDWTCSAPAFGTTAGLTEVTEDGFYTGTSLWYQFTATSVACVADLHDVVYQYGNPFSKLRVELYEGTCDGLQLIDGSFFLYGVVATNLTPGATYYIRVSGDINAGASFQLCVLTVDLPPNDDYSGAVPLPVWPSSACENTVAGTTISATPSPYSGSGCDIEGDVWYSFVASSNQQIVNISNVEPATSASIHFEVFQWDGYFNGYLGCYPAQIPVTLNNLTPGQTYMLRLGDSYNPVYRFEICISTPQPDLSPIGLYPEPYPCNPGAYNEIGAVIYNGAGVVPVGGASFTLTVSGANSGTYVATNPTPLYQYNAGIVTFYGVDLSVPGESQFEIRSMAPYDINPDDDIFTYTFTGLPLRTLYFDADGDGYGNPVESLDACYDVVGYVDNNTDCDDTNPDINPGAYDVCNGIDDNCNGLTDADDPDVLDTQIPEITCPDNIVVSNDPGACSALVNYNVTATDNCTFTLTQNSGFASGQAFPVGTTLNSFSVSDPGGNHSDCSFTVKVQKTADPEFLYAYTVIGFNDVFMKQNTVQSGGVGLVNAGKKARLQLNTAVTAPNTFVKAPILELTGGSQATTAYTGQVTAGTLPAFQANSTPSNNNLNIPNNSAPVTLTLASYGNIVVGINSTVTFSGQGIVRIKELTIKDGATVLFAQNTQVLINKGMAIAKNTDINPGGGKTVQIFAQENVTVDRGSDISAYLYTLKDLRLEKASLAVPTTMNGLFIAGNVYAQDFVNWNWDPNCPFSASANVAGIVADRNDAQTARLARLQIFPNPASEEAQLVFSVSTDCEAILRLSDLTGTVLQIKRFTAVQGENQYRLDLGALQEGVYSVEVLAQGKREVEKLVVLRP